MHRKEPAMVTRAPTRIGPRLPRWSETAPAMICPKPLPMKKLASERPIIVDVVANDDVIAGNAGVYMSVAKGGTAAWTDSVSRSPTGMIPVAGDEGGSTGGGIGSVSGAGVGAGAQ